jgi:dTDP-4-amino-4,6-dideoxygalactose transaminase
MSVPFLDLKWQHERIAESVRERFERVFADSSFTGGVDVPQFEEHFAAYLGVPHVVGVDNGTDALTLAYHALGLKAGDEVVMMPTTFIATAAAALHIGVKPTFVDIDPVTRNIDCVALEAAITSRTKGIVAVHLYGDVAPMDIILDIARRHGLLVIEDAAQAQGATYKGKRAGSLGDIATFSFYPGKNLGAYGQAGAIATKDRKVRDTLRMLRSHGESEKYHHDVIGWNSRLDTLQAIVLDEKLKKLDEWNEMRRAIAKIYDAELADLPLRLPPQNQDIEHMYHLYVVEVLEGDRDEFRTHLKNKGIDTGIHYPVPLHLTPALHSLGYARGAFPNAETYASRILSLPIFPGQTPEQSQEVVAAVRSFFHG